MDNKTLIKFFLVLVAFVIGAMILASSINVAGSVMGLRIYAAPFLSILSGFLTAFVGILIMSNSYNAFNKVKNEQN